MDFRKRDRYGNVSCFVRVVTLCCLLLKFTVYDTHNNSKVFTRFRRLDRTVTITYIAETFVSMYRVGERGGMWRT